MKFMFAFFLKELFLAFYLFLNFLGLLSGIIYFQTKINQDLNANKNDLILPMKPLSVVQISIMKLNDILISTFWENVTPYFKICCN